MNPVISPLEFLLTNVICFAAGAATVVALNLAAKAVHASGKRAAQPAS
ncbi:hypothetical protein CSV86_011870 [Pseudomonas putida CSV86]|uniref:Uncharacterized protein n=1 Tax=Pseudomonas bharatica CSV86 TaxID=1005395 RepID=L1LSI2_9PSED|nr:hypothetical protein [Pseudomonas bharatica]NNJ15879.1 hypothetical protein [Pseudomonas bharatica CSV86]